MATIRNLKRGHHIFIFLIISAILTISITLIVPYVCKRLYRMRPISQFTKPKHLPRYFAIDLDDTFHTKDTESMAKNTEAFKFLKSKGITPFFCTGRDLYCTSKLLGDEFSRETQYYGYPGVYVNGALVYDASGNILKMQTFSKNFLKKFRKFIVDNSLLDKTIFFTENGMFSLEPSFQEGIDFLRRHKMNEPSVITFEELLEKNVVSITFPTKGFDIEGLEKNVDYQVKFCYEIIAQLSPSLCNKKDGIELLLKTLQAKPEDCAFIGDGYNDTESMEYCKVSFAVGNAKDEVKQHANWVSDLTADQGAFAKVVDCMYK